MKCYYDSGYRANLTKAIQWARDHNAQNSFLRVYEDHLMPLYPVLDSIRTDVRFHEISDTWIGDHKTLIKAGSISIWKEMSIQSLIHTRYELIHWDENAWREFSYVPYYVTKSIFGVEKHLSNEQGEVLLSSMIPQLPRIEDLGLR